MHLAVPDLIGGLHVALSPDGKAVAFGDNTGVIRVHDTTVGKRVAEFKGQWNGSLTHLTFVPDGQSLAGINDTVCATSAIGRMVELAWAVGGEDLGVQPCDGVICATSTGSTAYNLSSGGPVLVWGLDAMAVTFVSPHSLHARPLVVPRGLELTVRNVTRGGPAVKVIADGVALGELGLDRQATVRLGERRALLALLPEMTFFHRYRETFAS